MRYLNKIIFINSAHIPFGEVHLDGNINLMGNQGVGKSTILRAILFFYTATTESSKLGIARGKQSFTDFYFESPNSYLVYEVVRDDSRYTVAAMLLQGRVVFRFIDAPYSRDWFFDENNTAYSSWGEIIAKIGKNISKETVENYETYRDIIFGNRRAVKQKMAKYAIAESEKYQNIPRVIRNVFLNAELRSSDIKYTVISSIGEDVPPVDLNRMRSEVQDFDRHYDDLSLWFSFNSRGKVPVRLEAEEIASRLRRYSEISDAIAENVAKMNYACRRAKKELPKLREEMLRLAEKKEKTETQIEDRQKKHEDKLAKLNQEIGKLKAFLEQIKSAKADYERMGIQGIIEECEQEPIVRAKREETMEQRDILTRQYKDIETKYEQLGKQAETARVTLVQKVEELFFSQRRNALEETEKLKKEEAIEKEGVEKRYAGKTAELDDTSKTLAASRAQRAAELGMLDRNSFFRKERRDNAEALAEMNTSLATNRLQLAHAEEEVAKINEEFAKEENLLKEAQAREMAEAREALEATNGETEKVRALLARLDSTFYGWLESNKPDWRENIGKVVREEDVLFSETLNPALASAPGNDLFGVAIDVENSGYRPVDSDALKERLHDLQESAERQKEDMVRLAESHIQSQEVLRRKFVLGKKKKEDELKQLQAKAHNFKTEARHLQIEAKELEEKASDAFDARKNELETQLEEISGRIAENEKEREKTLAAKKRAVSAITREYDRKIDEINVILESNRLDRDQKVMIYNADCEARMKEIAADREKELANQGVKTERLGELERELGALETRLREIEEKKITVREYRTRCRELLDHEPKYKDDLQKNLDSLDKLKRENYAQREKLIQRLEETNRLWQTAQNRSENLQRGINKVEVLRGNEFFARLNAEGEIKNEENCLDLCETINMQYNNRGEVVDEIKSKAVKFRGKFKSPELFGFEMTLASDRDFLELASKIRDFLEEEQYETHRKQVERTYAQIVALIAKEVSALNENKSKVQETILAINRDFAKKTFAGVIKQIKLEVKEEPDDPLMNVLGRIVRFAEENEGIALSDMPLFASLTNERENREAVDLLKALTNQLHTDTRREELTLADMFKLRFTIQENDKLYEHVENLANIGSDGTDVLVKAIVNIMLISVFKTKARSRTDNFYMHCIMDEINRLHPSNIQGILQFAARRNIWIVNACPTTFNVGDYRRTYMLEKDDDSYTHIELMIDKQLDNEEP